MRAARIWSHPWPVKMFGVGQLSMSQVGGREEMGEEGEGQGKGRDTPT